MDTDPAKGPFGILIYGTARPSPLGINQATGQKINQMLVREPMLIDLGKLDLLSPPWLRAGPGAAAADERGLADPQRWQDLLSSFAVHLGAKAAILCGAAGNSSLRTAALENLSEARMPAICLGMRLVPDQSEEDDGGAEICRSWIASFESCLTHALKSKKNAAGAWAEAPEGLASAGLKSLFFGAVKASDHAALALWAPALLARSHARILKESIKPSGAKRSRQPAPIKRL